MFSPGFPAFLRAGAIRLLALAVLASGASVNGWAQECEVEPDAPTRRNVWIDRVAADADIVYTNSGFNKDVFLPGASAEMSLGGPLRLGLWSYPDPDDEQLTLDWKLGGGGQIFAGQSDVDLVQSGVGDFRLVEARMYYGTAGLGLRGQRAIQNGFTVASRLGFNFIAGEMHGKFNAIANDPLLQQVNIAAPDTSDFLWGGEVEWKVGLIGPRGWGLYGGCTYGGYRTQAISGFDNGSTYISPGITLERNFRWR